PSYSMSIPIRIVRFGFMILAASFGMYGLTIGIILLLIHLCHLNSFGVPYMSPLAPFDKTEQSDGIFRLPFRNKKQP
ncbi:spore germination protein, partial [Paenibacillus sp. TAF58]